MAGGGIHGRGCAWQEVCMAGGMHGWGMCGGGHAWQGGMCAWWGGACMARETATAMDGTHPTEMHSCLSKTNIGSSLQRAKHIGELYVVIMCSL